MLRMEDVYAKLTRSKQSSKFDMGHTCLHLELAVILDVCEVQHI